ncbi:MAG: spore germination protein [Eubacterium sp.]|nr:spore germination protein [Eubacterium sp.]
MFSSNDKISSRQIKRLLVFDLFGAASLLLPSQLAKSGDGIGVWSILAGMAFAGIYLWMLHTCCCRMPSDYMEYLKTGWGGFLARLLYLCYACLSIVTCAWAAKLLAELMCGTLLDNREFPWALLVVLLLALYGAAAGMEARARVYELLFWVLVIPLVILLLLCVRQVQVMQWFPLLGDGDAISWSFFWSGTWQCFAAFLPLTFVLFLIPHVQEPKKTCRAAAGATLLDGIALVVLYLILLGIFGSGALAKEEYPVITLMGMVKIPGDFIKRLDAVMVGGWFFTLYALIGTTLYYGVVIMRRALTGWEAYKKAGGIGKQVWFLALAVAAYGIAYWFYLSPQAEVRAMRMFYLAGVPFAVLVPAVSLFLCKGEAERRQRAQAVAEMVKAGLEDEQGVFSAGKQQVK